MINFFSDFMDKNYWVTTFISVNFNLRRPRETNFADIVKIATVFVIATFNYSNKAKRNENYALKCNLYLCFLRY